MPNISILVVEDDAPKLAAVARAATSVSGVTLARIIEARDAVTAKRLLRQQTFDLLVLDLRIPNRIDQTATDAGGSNLLREVMRRPQYKVPHHIVGITAHEGLRADLAPTFSEHLWPLLYFDNSSDGWRVQLMNKIKHIMKSKQALRYSDGVTYEADLAIVTALDTIEFEAVQALSSEWKEQLVPFDDTLYLSTTFRDGGKEIAVVAAHAPRMGMASSAVLATKMIHNFRPRWLCMCGIAAGVRGKVNLGDILAADPSWDWGSGKQDVRDGRSHFSPAPNQIPIETGIRTKLRRYARDDLLLAKIRAGWLANKPDCPLRLHVEPVASGAAVLADRTYVDFINEQQRKFVGAEMEVYGMYVAGENCAKPRPATFALKSVCDFADEQKSDEFQAYAAYTSARFLHTFAVREFPSPTQEE